jgi:hypothetical protein
MSSHAKHAIPNHGSIRSRLYTSLGVLPLAVLIALATLPGLESPTPAAATTIHTVVDEKPLSLTWKHPEFHIGTVTVTAPIRYPYTYRVGPGDTLSGLATKVYGRADAWTLIYFSNHLHGTTIYVGQELKIVRLVGSPPAPPVFAQAPTGHTTSKPVSTSTPAPPASSGSLQAYAQSLFGSQYSCADNIIVRESGWRVNAANGEAYGIPQANPGSKMASAGADWQTDGDTQLRWMLGYVDGTYGGACNAWAFWQAHGAY